jgi:hypothetical protein
MYYERIEDVPELTFDIDNVQAGISAGVDFENNTWTFDMPKGFQASAGKYIIVKVVHNSKVMCKGE